MLKKIAVADVSLGMHIQAVEGSWLEHPFWKMKFVLRDERDLAKLQASSTREVWIDTALGVDVPNAVIFAAQQCEIVAPVVTAVATARQPRDASKSFEGELQHATMICRRAADHVESMFGEARLGRAVDAERCLPIVTDIAESVFRNPSALVSLARLKTQDDYSFMHSVAVCALMVSFAREKGADEAACRRAGLAGMLHDLGKAMMPLEVLNKPGRLTEEEFATMQTHPARGHEILHEARGVPEPVLDVCLHHHEKIDGTGYPYGLAGGDISEIARMGAICDVYDAVTSNRPYKTGWDPAESIARMASWKGHFDPTLFATFVKSIGIYPIGSLVRLESQRLAVVVEQNPACLIAPVVRAFFSLKSRMPIPVQRIDLASLGCSDRIAQREPIESWSPSLIDGLWAGDTILRRT